MMAQKLYRQFFWKYRVGLSLAKKVGYSFYLYCMFKKNKVNVSVAELGVFYALLEDLPSLTCS